MTKCELLDQCKFLSRAVFLEKSVFNDVNEGHSLHLNFLA